MKTHLHTPGPWSVGLIYHDDDGQPEIPIQAHVNGLLCHPAAICLQFPYMQGMQEANANLIATAPELLDALLLALKELHACQAVIHLRGGFDPAYVRDAQLALEIGLKAIAKATPKAS